ncbi:envelope stress sensor histidine kinase CpxA [Zophobihabitans entericus]|uniref:histidine kinase n=1 Tax=Zophobihabitans entericus TaxID=1635327 RepID=A0A6G9IF63_9GAMM|nr:envelope stress sensor histidine kinase CpxA [Zophobihabitans entericus]QIQ22344.1 envelope stress sensor histidine kinase CpxA [Zophobihabitans entericus]
MFNRLTVRIFIVFLFTVAFFLMLAITLPKLDSRNLTYISNQEKEVGIELAQSLETELLKIPQNGFRWWMRFIVVMDKAAMPGQSLFIVTPTEQILTANATYRDIVQNFSELSNNVSEPAKKVYGSEEVLGPFQIAYGQEEYLLYVVQPVTALQSQFANILFDHPLLLLSLTMLLSSPLLLWLSWSLAKPARRLKKVADEVARGNLQEWPDLESGSYEFQATGASFNHMLRELKHTQESQQRLISDISHELRTPLTRLRLASAILRRKQGESSELQRIEDESGKLDAMISELLSLARNQYTEQDMRDLMTVEELWELVLEDAEFEAEQLGKSFKVTTDIPNVRIFGFSQALSSALENVIRNAFRYSDKRIEIGFHVHDEQLMVIIDDDGPGVSEKEYEQIFMPFYRTSEARDRTSGGTGLGLAIVRKAINQDKGTVYATKSPLQGLRVVITLPLATNK